MLKAPPVILGPTFSRYYDAIVGPMMTFWSDLPKSKICNNYCHISGRNYTLIYRVGIILIYYGDHPYGKLSIKIKQVLILLRLDLFQQD